MCTCVQATTREVAAREAENRRAPKAKGSFMLGGGGGGGASMKEKYERQFELTQQAWRQGT